MLLCLACLGMKVMTIYAHPADTITNCGGTLALHATRGDDIVALILTHGGRIHPNRYAEEWRRENPDVEAVGAGPEEVAANKRRELERAAEIVGIGKLILLDFDDNYAAVDERIVDRVAEEVARERPDIVICDYPLNPTAYNPHTVATMMAFAGLSKVSLFLRNLDGHDDFHVKQVFMTSLPVYSLDALSTSGVRNDLYIDTTSVVGMKIAAMDQFASQGYDGLFARKLIESHDGEAGRVAGVNFAEAFCRLYNETHTALTVTDAAMQADPLTRHRTYSTISVREAFPVGGMNSRT